MRVYVILIVAMLVTVIMLQKSVESYTAFDNMTFRNTQGLRAVPNVDLGSCMTRCNQNKDWCQGVLYDFQKQTCWLANDQSFAGGIVQKKGPSVFQVSQSDLDDRGAWVPQSKAHKAFSDMVSQKLDQFLQHLSANYADDPRAQRAIQAFQNHTMFMFSKGNAMSMYKRHYMHVNPYRPVNRQEGFINHTILHELAHSTPPAHGDEWRDAFIFFLKVATEELGWTVFMSCDRCQNYGLCDKAMCPKCTWNFTLDTCPGPYWKQKTIANNFVPK